MMGQQQTVAEQQAGGALRGIVLVVLVATLTALTMVASATPALAKGGDNFGGKGKGQGGGIGGSSQDPDGVSNNPHRPVVVVVDYPNFS
jgi:hypothetical protein